MVDPDANEFDRAVGTGATAAPTTGAPLGASVRLVNCFKEATR
jgi:hypothetical protein